MPPHIGLVSASTDLGVMIVRSLLVKLLREHYPDARIVVLGEAADIAWLREFYERSSWADACVPIETERPSTGPQVRRLQDQLLALRFDIIIVSPWSRFPCAIPSSCGIPMRVGLARDEAMRRELTHPVALSEPEHRDLHWVTIVEGYARALGLDGFKGAAAHVPFVRVPRRRDAGDRRTRPIVAVHAGGSPAWNRRWPRQRFERLCLALAAHHGASIRLIGSRYETADNAVVVDSVRAALRTADIEDVSGCPIAETIGYVAEADLFVGNDSGPMNIAVAVGTPIVAIRGADPENFRADVVDRAHVVCSNWINCSRHHTGTALCERGCPVAYERERQQYPACMDAIPFEHVWTAVERQLSEDGPAYVQ